MSESIASQSRITWNVVSGGAGERIIRTHVHAIGASLLKVDHGEPTCQLQAIVPTYAVTPLAACLAEHGVWSQKVELLQPGLPWPG